MLTWISSFFYDIEGNNIPSVRLTPYQRRKRKRCDKHIQHGKRMQERTRHQEREATLFGIEMKQKHNKRVKEIQERIKKQKEIDSGKLKKVEKKKSRSQLMLLLESQNTVFSEAWNDELLEQQAALFLK